MKFDIFFTFEGPAGTSERDVPNIHNPIERASLEEMLAATSKSLPGQMFGSELEIVGIRIDRVKED